MSRATNDDLRRDGSRGAAESDHMAIFVDLGEKKCSGEVKLDGSGVPVVPIDSPLSIHLADPLSIHLADPEILIIKRSLNQVTGPSWRGLHASRPCLCDSYVGGWALQPLGTRGAGYLSRA